MTAKASGVLSVMASVLLLAGIAALIWPAAAGGRATFVMVDGVSMLPTMHTGDLVLMRAEPAYQPGEIVAYRVPRGQFGEGAVVIHRVVGGTQARLVIQGDNKSVPDPWTPSHEDVLGRRVLLVPRAAGIVQWLADPIRLAALAASVTVASVLTTKPKRRRTVATDAGPVG